MQTFKASIEQYCRENSITIPPGFGRNSPNRYALIRKDLSPPKVTATTWFKQEDIIYYCEHVLIPQIGLEAMAHVQILDFKTGRRFRFAEPARLLSDGTFSTSEQNA